MRRLMLAALAAAALIFAPSAHADLRRYVPEPPFWC